MNVLKPELIWIDGRCYRFFGNKESDTCNIVPYVEDNYMEDHEACEDEYDTTDIKIEPHGATKFKHTFYVAKSFFPYIVGSKNTVRKKLENETNTVILIPNIGQDGDIVIIGFDHKGIITARHRIDLLVEATKDRLNVTHFLSIPMNEDQIIMNFNIFKNDVLTNSGKKSRGVNEMCFQKSSKLHLTLGVFTLLDDTEKDQAIKALNYCKDHIIKPKIKEHGQICIRLQGTEIMNDDPTDVNVLFGKIIDTSNVLQEIVDEIINHYTDIGLIRKNRNSNKLHVTLMNAKFKLDDKESNSKHVSRFDAQNIMKFYSNNFSNKTMDAQKKEQHEEYQYLNLIEKIMKEGAKCIDRTGVGTLSIFGTHMRFNLRDDIFPLLTTKKVFWKGVVEELLWFIKGSTNAKELSMKKVYIWDANSSREFLDSCGFSDREVGDLGPVYGFQWRHFGAKYKNMHTDYQGQGIDQLQEVINKIRNSPNDRRIIMTAWNPTDISQMALPPCHCLVQFYVKNGELSCQLYQRSADMGLGVPFNIASYSLLTYMLAHITNLKPGEFIHTMGDCHVYLNHISALEEQIKRVPKPFSRLKIVRNVRNINDFVTEDFELIGYNPHPKLSMAMAI
ncbi:thymidylate synthase isoform X2 [Ptiloglossa arizonensis]|uniref:thymidylate synthase isoform X2 n=1 Tax=Ptiloglossa arizonensis TaxID=3350558 RepID=UPI003FA0D654